MARAVRDTALGAHGGFDRFAGPFGRALRYYRRSNNGTGQ